MASLLEWYIPDTEKGTAYYWQSILFCSWYQKLYDHHAFFLLCWIKYANRDISNNSTTESTWLFWMVHKILLQMNSSIKPIACSINAFIYLLDMLFVHCMASLSALFSFIFQYRISAFTNETCETRTQICARGANGTESTNTIEFAREKYYCSWIRASWNNFLLFARNRFLFSRLFSS